MNKYNELKDLLSEGRTAGEQRGRAHLGRYTHTRDFRQQARAFGAAPLDRPDSGEATPEEVEAHKTKTPQNPAGKRKLTPQESLALKTVQARTATGLRLGLLNREIRALQAEVGKEGRADEGLRDALKGAARTALAVGAGYFGGQLDKKDESPPRAPTTLSQNIKPKGTPKYHLPPDFASGKGLPFTAATNREAASRAAANARTNVPTTRGAYIAKDIRNIVGGDSLPFSSGYKATTTPVNQASSDVTDVIKRADLNIPWNPEGKRQRIATARNWKRKGTKVL